MVGNVTSFTWLQMDGNHHSFESLVSSANGLETFMQSMAIKENEES